MLTNADDPSFQDNSRCEPVLTGAVLGRVVHLDVAQLIKHAFGLRTAVQERSKCAGKQPALFYLFAEPKAWSDGRLIAPPDIRRHRDEVQQFAELVHGDEVDFRWATYKTLLEAWVDHELSAISKHAQALHARFDV